MTSIRTPLATLSLLAAALMLASCTTQQNDGLAAAAMAPLADLNLVNAPIPPALRTAQGAPYARPASLACEALLADIRALDEVLGAELTGAERYTRQVNAAIAAGTVRRSFLKGVAVAQQCRAA